MGEFVSRLGFCCSSSLSFLDYCHSVYNVNVCDENVSQTCFNITVNNFSSERVILLAYGRNAVELEIN